MFSQAEIAIAYSTDQMQGIKWTRLFPALNTFIWDRRKIDYLQEMRKFYQKLLQQKDNGATQIHIWEGQIVMVFGKGAPGCYGNLFMSCLYYTNWKQRSLRINTSRLLWKLYVHCRTDWASYLQCEREGTKSVDMSSLEECTVFNSTTHHLVRTNFQKFWTLKVLKHLRGNVANKSFPPLFGCWIWISCLPANYQHAHWGARSESTWPRNKMM